VIGDAAAEVGPALFFSLLIITLSFIPVFTLEAQEGRLFSPLAFTKTYAMAAAAGLSVTLIPVLMGYLIRGRIPDEQSNPLNRFLIAAYRPLLNLVLCVAEDHAGPSRRLLLVVSLWPLQHIGGEFMPPLDEGDLLYMPSALPGLSAGKASELLQQTDRLIKTVPEVASVYGKAGRAETATDPAPLEMFETTIQFKPKDQWRAGMTAEKLVEELDKVVKCRAWPTSGCRRSATASTCWPPASRARSASRSPARSGRRSTALTRDRAGRSRTCPASAQRAGRAPDRRALRRRQHPARRRRTLRPEHRRRAVGGHVGRRRREHRRDRGRAAALPDQHALPARVRDSLEKLRSCPS
jgi:hypothetical protein